MTDKERIEKLIEDNNKLQAELIVLKTKSEGWLKELKKEEETREMLVNQLTKLKPTYNEISQELKKKMVSFFVRTYSLKQYDELSPHQVGQKAGDFIQNVVRKLPKFQNNLELAIINELQITTREPD
jgi:predicted nuclease with TOPRIM domain